MEEILGMLPNEATMKNFYNTTHYYLSVEEQNSQDPRKNYKYNFLWFSYYLEI